MNKPNDTSSPIRLRAMEPEDLDLLYHIENDRSVWGVSSTNVPYSRYALHDYVAHAQNDIYTDKQVRLIITKATGETIGLLDLMNFDPRHQRAELGIVIMKPYRRQGYATAAIRQILSDARSIWHLHQLYAITEQSNAASCQLFKGLGFSTSCVLHDWLSFADGFHDALLLQYFL